MVLLSYSKFEGSIRILVQFCYYSYHYLEEFDSESFEIASVMWLNLKAVHLLQPTPLITREDQRKTILGVSVIYDIQLLTLKDDLQDNSSSNSFPNK